MEENKALTMNLEIVRTKLAQVSAEGEERDDEEGEDEEERAKDRSRSTNLKNVSFDKSPEKTTTTTTLSSSFVDAAPIALLKCRLCGVDLEDACKRCLTASIQDEIECDDLDSSLTIKDPVVVRLKHGGSAYGSRESLNKIAIISPENEFGNSVIGVFNVDATSAAARSF